VGKAHCAALATLPNIKYPSDIIALRSFFEHDLGTPPIEFSAPSQVKPFDSAGIGCIPVPELLTAMTVESCEFPV
jgi:hypothetical protein